MTELEKKYMSSAITTPPNTNNNNNNNKGSQSQQAQSQPQPITLLGGGGYSRPVVQWYPGHIAKAERALAVTMKAVDVVVEVRDARIPAATAHPSVSTQWCQNKPRIVVLTHTDAIPRLALTAWHTALLQSNDLLTRNSKTPSGNTTKVQSTTTDPQQQQVDVVVSSANQLIQNIAAEVETVRIKYNPSTSTVSPTSEAKAIAKSRKTLQRSFGSSGMNVKKIMPLHYSNAKSVIFVNAKEGTGIHGLTRAILAAGQHIQDRRIKRGLLGRPLRVGVLGYPNVGKSALINKLIGRRRCPTANLPGVTRSLQWIRVKHDTVSNTKRTQEFELLDSPGIIPAVLADQSDAMLLAACHCIGEASYDNQAVASYLCEWLLAVHTLHYHKQVAPHWRTKCIERYKFDPLRIAKPKQLYPHEESEDTSNGNHHHHHNRLTGEDMLYLVADNTCQGDPEDAARKILQDFRSGRMGPICLQVAPVVVLPSHSVSSTSMTTTTSVDAAVVSNTFVSQSNVLPPQKQDLVRETMNDPDDIIWQIQKQQRRVEQQDRALAALETVRVRGIELPQSILSLQQSMNSTTTATSEVILSDEQEQDDVRPSSVPTIPTSTIGKGLFEGW
jgi:ribosome biogenesis GTPase A